MFGYFVWIEAFMKSCPAVIQGLRNEARLENQVGSLGKGGPHVTLT